MWNPLTEDFKPETLLFRDEQLKEMLSLALHPLPQNQWLQGDRGLGKTLVSRFFMDEVHARNVGKCHYFNWQSKYKKSLEDLNLRSNLGIPSYALSPSAIANKIISETKEDETVFLIIDEPQKAHFFRDVDHAVFEFYQSFLGKRKLVLIFLSQLRYKLLQTHFSPDTLSRLRLKPIMFAPYNVNEMTQIFTQRLNLMLEPDQYQLDALILLGKHIRRIGGDIRESLEILRVAIEQAENVISLPIMERAIEWGKQRWWKKELSSLPPHWAFILYMTAEQCLKYNTTTTQQNHIKYVYLSRCNFLKVNPLGTRTIYHAFMKLAEKGYFETNVEGYGQKRRTKLTLDKDDRDHILTVGKEMEWEIIL